jgi:predicted kinase
MKSNARRPLAATLAVAQLNLSYRYHRMSMPRRHRRDDGDCDRAVAEAAIVSEAIQTAISRWNPRRRSAAPPLVIATVGPTGSGKLPVAERIATEIGGAVLSINDFRHALRGARPSIPAARARALMERAANDLLLAGCSVALHADFADPLLRASLERRLAELSRLFDRPQPAPLYVHVTCEPHVLFGRIARSNPSPYYREAPSKWQDKAGVGVAAKMTEAARCLSRHFHWNSWSDEAQLVPLELPIAFATSIDTTERNAWKSEAEEFGRSLLYRLQAQRAAAPEGEEAASALEAI